MEHATKEVMNYRMSVVGKGERTSLKLDEWILRLIAGNSKLKDD